MSLRKLIYFIKNYMDIVFAVVIVTIGIINIGYQIGFISSIFRIIAYSLFYMIASMGIYSLYRTLKNRGYILIIVVVGFITLYSNELLILPSLALIPAIFIKKYSSIYRITTGVLITVLTTIFLLSQLFSGVGKDIIVEKIPSPNNIYTLLKVYSDKGSLGGHTIIKVEKNYCNILQVRKTLLIDSRRIDIRWINDKNVMLNDKKAIASIP